jgi:deazaflavin-dependent oxidoreductase (nitroreductase family)
MPKKVSDPSPPRGLTRLAARLPIWLYTARLGWFLGNRALMLTHIGRVSGKKRQVVLEVVRHDGARDAYIVASGWGEKADWYQNLEKNPEAAIQVGRQDYVVIAERLPPEQAALEMSTYGRRHPGALRVLARVMGYQLEETAADYAAFGRLIPMIALRLKRD